MIINVMDENFERKSILNTYISLTWEENYQDKGGFVLTLDDAAASLIEMNDVLFVAGMKTAMIVKNKEIVSELRRVMFTGYTTLHLLSNRVIRDPVNVVNAEDGIRRIIQDNTRWLARFSMSEAKGFDEQFEMQYQWDELLPAISEIAVNSGLGIRMIYDRPNKQHVFDLYKGVDRRATQNENIRVFFGEEFKNIYNLSINDDFSLFKNFAYVTGGNDETPVVVEVGDATGGDRYEMWVDGRDISLEDGETYASVSYLNRLRGKGVAALSEHIRRQSFKIDVDPVEYSVKYNLGDLISCKSNRYGVQLGARIIKHAFVVENNILKTKITVGDAKLDAIGEMKLWK